MMGRKNYDTDLSDEQWELIEPLVRFDADGPGKRPTIPLCLKIYECYTLFGSYRVPVASPPP